MLVLLLSKVGPDEREGALQLSQGLFVREGQELGGHRPHAGIAHEVIELGGDLHRVLRVSAGAVQQVVDERFAHGDPARAELLADVQVPVFGIDAEAMTGGIGEVVRDGEAIERLGSGPEYLAQLRSALPIW